jgi:hypothetical protein
LSAFIVRGRPRAGLGPSSLIFVPYGILFLDGALQIFVPTGNTSGNLEKGRPKKPTHVADQSKKGFKSMRKTLTAVAIAAATIAGAAYADDTNTVRAFYSDILTDPSGTTAERYFELFSPDVVSIPTPPGGEGAQGMLNTVGFLGQVVPDLDLGAAGDHRNLGDGRFVVRGLATRNARRSRSSASTRPPARASRSMSIDIVTVEDGLITHIYHLEDWTWCRRTTDRRVMKKGPGARGAAGPFSTFTDHGACPGCPLPAHLCRTSVPLAPDVRFGLTIRSDGATGPC